MVGINFQNIRAEPAVLMEFFEESNDSLTNFFYKEKNRLWVKFSRDGKMNIFSQTGKGRQNALFYCRYNKNISPLNIIKFKGLHYFLTDCIKENDYLKISSVQIEPVKCSYSKIKWVKDEFNRPIQTKDSQIDFMAFFTEKYLKNQETEVSVEIADTFIAICHKSLDFKEGELIKINDNSSGIPMGNYIIEITHKTNIYHNEYQLTRRVDV